MPRKYDVTFIGPVVWGSVWGHGPELAAYLAARYEVAWLDPPMPPVPAKNSFIDRKSYPVPALLELVRRRTGFAPGVMYGLMMELRNLWAVACRRGSRVITYYPAGSLLALLWCRLSGRRALFVYADKPDIISSPSARLAARLLLGLTARLATAGTVATSKPLLEDLKKYNSRCELIPNGVSLERVAACVTGKKRSAANEPFTVAFAGVFGEWVDFSLVLGTAAACPWARFVLIGDGPQFERVREQAAGLANVVLTGALPHAGVFTNLAGVSVCLVPFTVNELTDRVCPVKLFEYWALGKTVIGTPCRELARLAQESPEALHLAADVETTVRLLTAFRDNPELLASSSRSALEAVKGYDWKVLGRHFENRLDLSQPAN